MIGIYKITNLLNNKVYIGQSIDIEDRWKQHIYKAFNSKEKAYNSIIHEAFRKYGVDNFKFEVIEECGYEELDKKEQYWIGYYDSLSPQGYNIMPGGQKTRTIPKSKLFCSNCGIEITGTGKTNLCYKCYQLTQRKVERPSKEELFQLLVQEQGGFTKIGKIYGVTDNTIRDWCKGYELPVHSSDYKVVKEKQQYKKAVAQLDKETEEIITIYESTAAAARALGKKSYGHITEACNGKIKTCYGFKWKYI